MAAPAGEQKEVERKRERKEETRKRRRKMEEGWHGGILDGRKEPTMN